MATITITVNHVSGEVASSPVLPVHRVAFERQFKVPFASLRDEPFDERLMWLGYYATTRGRQSPPTFDAWLEGIESVDIDIAVAEVDDDPLGKTASSGASLPAPSSQVPGSPSTD